MGIWDRLTGQFVDVIEWTHDDGQTMAWRFERQGNEIKYGAKLIVREGQSAVFIREGRLADVFTPGTYTLETRNLPILSTLAAWKHGFDSPFKAEVWFVSTKRFTGLRWGTKNPVMVRDQEFGPVRLRAFGTFSVEVMLPARFLQEIVGTESHLQRDEITDTLRNFVVSRFGALIGESQVPILDLAGRYDELGNFLEHRAREDFLQFGLVLKDVLVENVSLPAEVEKALDRRSSMAFIADTDSYLRFQAAEGLGRGGGDGGAMASGIGAGLGLSLARSFAQEAPPPAQAAPTTPPPVPVEPPLFLVENGARSGPFPPSAWSELVRTGRLTAETLVWRQGLASWVPATTLTELGALLPPEPPPVP